MKLGCLLALGLMLVSAPARSNAVGFFHTAEESSLVVLAKVLEVNRLDTHSYQGRFYVQEIFLSKDRLPASNLNSMVKVDSVATIVWEELSQGRSVRFKHDDTLVLCANSLPTHSIWKKRIASPKDRSTTKIIAGSGRCFLDDLTESTVNAVRGYFLAVQSHQSHRSTHGHPHKHPHQPAQYSALVSMIHNAQPSLALEAIGYLAASVVNTAVNVADNLSADDRVLLLRSLLRPLLTDLLIELLSSLSLDGTLKQLEQWQWQVEHPEIYFALKARLRDGLEAEETTLLAASPYSNLRELAAKFSKNSTLLRSHLVNESETEVIVAATARIRALDKAESIPLLLNQLNALDIDVRNNAAKLLASFGQVAAKQIQSAVMATREQAAFSGVLALSLMGQNGMLELTSIAQEHPQESVKILAAIALGQPIGHQH